MRCDWFLERNCSDCVFYNGLYMLSSGGGIFNGCEMVLEFREVWMVCCTVFPDRFDDWICLLLYWIVCAVLCTVFYGKAFEKAGKHEP